MFSENQMIGKWGEILSCFLPGTELANADNFNRRFDILFEDYETNVKLAKVKYNKGRYFFSFKIHVGYSTCDFFLLIGYTFDGSIKPLKAWLIPAEIVTTKYLSIGLANAGKWAKYEYPLEEINQALSKFQTVMEMTKTLERMAL